MVRGGVAPMKLKGYVIHPDPGGVFHYTLDPATHLGFLSRPTCVGWSNNSSVLDPFKENECPTCLWCVTIPFQQ
jgi:hypothetical protein